MIKKYLIECIINTFYCHLDLYDSEGDWISRERTKELRIDPPMFTKTLGFHDWDKLYLWDKKVPDDRPETLRNWVRNNIHKILEENNLTEDIQIEFELDF